MIEQSFNYQNCQANFIGVSGDVTGVSDVSPVKLVLLDDDYTRRLLYLANQEPDCLKICLKRPNLITAVVAKNPTLLKVINKLANEAGQNALDQDVLYQAAVTALNQSEPQTVQYAAQTLVELIAANELGLSQARLEELALAAIKRQPRLFKLLAGVLNTSQTVTIVHAAVAADGNNFCWVEPSLRTADLALLAANTEVPAEPELITALSPLTDELIAALLRNPVNLRVLPQSYWTYATAAAALVVGGDSICWLQAGFGDSTAPGPLFDYKDQLIELALTKGQPINVIWLRHLTMAHFMLLAKKGYCDISGTLRYLANSHFDYQQRQTIYTAFIQVDVTLLKAVPLVDLNGDLIDTALAQFHVAEAQFHTATADNLKAIMPTIMRYLDQVNSPEVTLKVCWAVVKLPDRVQPGQVYHHFGGSFGPPGGRDCFDYTLQPELIDWVVSIEPSNITLFTGPSAKPIPGLWRLWLKAVTAQPGLIKFLAKTLTKVEDQISCVNSQARIRGSGRPTGPTNLSDLGWTADNIAEIYRIAVTQDGLNLEWVVNSTRLSDQTKTQLSWLAVQQNPQAIQYCVDPSDELCLLAVQADVTTLKWVAKHYYGVI